MDKEVILAIVNGPGATWGWIVFSIMGGFVIIYIVKCLNGYDRAIQEGRNAERREGMDQIRAQVARLSHDQQQLVSKLEPSGVQKYG